jgi:lipid-binding SYLF domain-containing protein
MARLISAKGVAAGGNIGSPPQGMKWIVKWVLLLLHTGTGSGTRSASILISFANAGNFGLFIAFTGSQTGVSSTFSAVGTVGPNVAASSNTQFSQFPEIFAVDVINLQVNLISGDTVDYYILVEEVSS